MVNHKKFGNICIYIEGATCFQSFLKRDTHFGNIHPEGYDPYNF